MQAPWLLNFASNICNLRGYITRIHKSVGEIPEDLEAPTDWALQSSQLPELESQNHGNDEDFEDDLKFQNKAWKMILSFKVRALKI